MIEPSLGNIHHYILKYILKNQYAPDLENISNEFNILIETAGKLLDNLAEYHGVVLHPNSSKIWIIHPFSLSPTGFTISSNNKKWWGTCAWCSFGAAHLIDDDVIIETRLGATGDLVQLEIKNKQLVQTDYVVHFPIKMTHAWDNVVYTCSVMLLFRNENEVNDWCETYNIQKGDVQPASTVFAFAGEWYGNHLHPEWVKWTNKEAVSKFKKFRLTSDIWKIPLTDERF